MRRQRQLRTTSGLSITVLIMFIGVFIIGPLSMFVFELARYNLADQQLKNCVDLAALTAACSTTGSDSTSASVTQTAAMNQAAYMFSQNSIFSYPLTTTPTYSYGTANPIMTPAANQAQLYFQFLDPTTKLPVAYGSDAGKILRITGAWGFVPSTSKFIGLAPGPYTIVETSDSGLPMLDVVLCLDLSASMDDFTNISCVQRYLNPLPYVPGVTGNLYKLASTGSYSDSSGSHVIGQGPLYYALQCTNATGCSANATWPMDYFSVAYEPSALVSQGCNITAHGLHTGDYAKSALTAFTSSAGQYSDIVVNLDGSATMNYGCTVTNANGTFTFPPYSASDATGKGLGIMVEAARGNLESVAAANLAHVPYLTWGITPKAGWWDAYYQTVMSAQTGYPVVTSGNPAGVIPLRHPIGDAIMAAQNFFGVMKNDADVHFGLVCFGSAAGTTATDQMPNNNGGSSISALTNYTSGAMPSLNYPPDNVLCPNPMIALNPSPGPTYNNFSTSTPPASNSVNGAIFRAPNGGTEPYNISTVMAYGGTNIADALDMALSMHLGSKTGDPSGTPGTTTAGARAGKSLARLGATRAIVLFTDGLPTAGGDDKTADPYSQAEANCAASAGIPIYTIGLCMVPSLQADQTTVLTDQTGSSGIAALSKNNASFSQTTSASGLNNVFQNVARQLVQLVQ